MTAIRELIWRHVIKPLRSDRSRIKRQWRQMMGYDIDLSEPRTFNEKIQYLKLLERKPEYTVMADKYAGKQWIADRVGEQYVPKLLGMWNRAEDIDFDALPERFVLKTTHDSGGVCVITDKAACDRSAINAKLNEHLQYDHAGAYQEKVYKGIPHRIIAEEYLPDDENPGQSARDYKLFCFNGVPRFAKVDRDRFNGHKASYFALDTWRPLYFREELFPTLDDPDSEVRPTQLGEMVEIASKLSQGLPLLRVDFFVSGGRLYVGELTFFPGAGFSKLTPPRAETDAGDMIDLSAWRSYGGGYLLVDQMVTQYVGA